MWPRLLHEGSSNIFHQVSDDKIWKSTYAVSVDFFSATPPLFQNESKQKPTSSCNQLKMAGEGTAWRPIWSPHHCHDSMVQSDAIKLVVSPCHGLAFKWPSVCNNSRSVALRTWFSYNFTTRHILSGLNAAQKSQNGVYQWKQLFGERRTGDEGQQSSQYQLGPESVRIGTNASRGDNWPQYPDGPPSWMFTQRLHVPHMLEAAVKHRNSHGVPA